MSIMCWTACLHGVFLPHAYLAKKFYELVLARLAKGFRIATEVKPITAPAPKRNRGLRGPE